MKHFTQKQILFSKKCAKTAVQQCRISKFSGGGPPDPLFQGVGEGAGERRRGMDVGGSRTAKNLCTYGNVGGQKNFSPAAGFHPSHNKPKRTVPTLIFFTN